MTALAGASLDLHEGEIVALLGDNGAGKSTLIKAISGIVTIDSGEIELDGHPLRLRTPADARGFGIETVFQDLAVFDNLTGRERGPAGLGRSDCYPPKGTTTMARARKFPERRPGLARSRSWFDIGRPAPIGAVARAVAFASRVVILDEPTAALGVRESDEILTMVKRLPARGLSVIVVSHNMDHVVRVADRAVVMRRGPTVGEMEVRDGVQKDLVAMIMGAS